MRGKSGFRKCKRCQERHPYPSEFGVTRNGTQSEYCVHCEPRYRTCEKCGRRRQAPAQILPNGRVCLDCKREQQKARKRRYYVQNKERLDAQVVAWKAANPDRVKQHKRTAWERLKADPVRYENRLAEARIDRRLKGRSSGEELHDTRTLWGGYQPAPRANHAGCQLPTGPLREWLRQRYPGWPVKEIADRVGVDDSHIGKILNGKQKLISEHVADKIFVGADCTYMLTLLYPLEEAA